MERRKGKSVYRTIRDYVIITIAMLLGVIGVNVFLVPNQITTGGIVGIASIVYWGTGIPVQNTYFVLNALLLIAALAVLGWRFCAKTIYAVIVFTVASTVFQQIFGMNIHALSDQKFMACIVGGVFMGTSVGLIHALSDQKFMACIVGGVFMGTSVGLGLSAGGSTGGSDIIAAIVHKYRDVSLGRIILLCDMTIITSSYVVLRSWEKVLYGYVLLFIVSFCVDYVVNSLRQSVQFLIISDKYQEIGEAINKIADRGCSTLNGNGFYSKKDIKVIFCIAKRSESSLIFDLIDEIDPDAFVAQSAVTGVYGQGFDRVKVRKKISLEEINKQIGESAKQS